MAFLATAALVGAALLSPGDGSETAVRKQSTTEPEGSTPPVVTELGIDDPVALRVLAVRPNNPSLAILDLQAGTTTVYPPGAHALPPDAVSGAVITPRREVVIWTNETARLFKGPLDAVDLELEPSQPHRIDGHASALRIIPSPDGQRAWLVQPGLAYGPDRSPTVAELLELATARRLGRFDVDGSALPVAATNAGLVLNTVRLVDTGDGWTTDPGSERVVHLLEDGSIIDVGEGRAIAAGPDTIARLACPPSGQPRCDPYHSNDLLLSDLDGSNQRKAAPPTAGTWLRVGGPSIPSDAMPLQTVSPDGSKLLVGLGPTPASDGPPADSSLQVVDLNDGSSTTIAEFHGEPPVATWSAGGRWIALLFERDIRLLDAANPDTTVMLTGVIPPDHHPMAAG